MRAVLTLGALIALLFVVFGGALADSLHGSGACPAQTFDDKVDSTHMWYKVFTACNDHAAEGMLHEVYLQVFDWDDWIWKDYSINKMFSHSLHNVDRIADSRVRTVDPYQGLLCYRARSEHVVVEWSKGAFDREVTNSWGDCY